jgi:mannitol-1-/sugar-/sorbitol-6-/2-deoxyglucose-6-phosphatase
MRLFQFGAVLLDMDGTLVDSEKLWRSAEKMFAERHALLLTSEVQHSFVGKAVPDVMQFLIKHDGLTGTVEGRTQELETIVKELLPGVRENAGTAELIALLNEYKMPRAIASNSSKDIIAATLANQLWAKDIPKRFSVDDVAKGKPEPDLYLLAASNLGAKPEKCLVIEDSLTGTRAAVSARMTCCLITHGQDLHTELTPLIFRNLTEVLEWLQE